ncbi:MAG: hypothetical protein P2A85_09010 [Microcoleus anatoxicus]|uniref:hypothetical protein n=1 Tax=Microcoleus anatoxicus TaxID=2705319 RepID=UPI0036734CF0
MEQAVGSVLNNSKMGKLLRVFLAVAIAHSAIKIHIVGSKSMLWGESIASQDWPEHFMGNIIEAGW